MLAWYALQQYDEFGTFVSDILQDAEYLHSLSNQQRAQAVDIASGTIRRRRTIDALLASQISRPRANVEPDLWRLLQLGTYQVVFSKTPDHASVSSMVELTRRAGCGRWSGFVNGILRNVLRLMSGEQSDTESGDSIPCSDGTWIGLNQTIFPNPSEHPVEYFGTAFSLPRAVARRWVARYAAADLQRCGFHSLGPPSTYLRVNTLRTTVDDVKAAFEADGLEVEPTDHPSVLQLSSASRVTKLPGFAEGWWMIQDIAATMATEMLRPQPGERILDLCAAPGGKTTHLAELMGDEGEIIASDVSAQRLHRVTENAERLQLKFIQTLVVERDGSDLPEGPFDAVLVDVPCSNTGVLSRRPEARWRFKESELQELTQIQTRLLLSAFERVRPGGRILYSTCSIEPEETTAVVDAVTDAVSDLKTENSRLLLPGQPGDGAFQALLIRK